MDGAAVGSSVLDLGRIRCRRLPVRAVPLSGEAVIIVVERADIKTGMKGFILIMFLLMCTYSAEWMMIKYVCALVGACCLLVALVSMFSQIFDLTIICTPTRCEFKHVNRNQLW